ncbi:hypothetical protein [Microbacterium deminutum]|uniref:DUF7882 domain-containing protein n=1 Tax=Microbacterium deminutum TaxID=344164 RepID=A0ABP5CHN4_9MICO
MGTLHYGNGMLSASIPDWVLAHLKVVATTKLRRNESFTVSWRHPDHTAGGRSTLWMQPSIPLLFEFDSPEPVTLDPDYLHALANAANSAGGMSIDWPDEASVAARSLAA